MGKVAVEKENNDKRLYYMLNKPRGYITARQDKEHHTVMEFFPEELANVLFPVGRLDKDTEGLLLFTNDGQFDQTLMHPDSHASKTYEFYGMGTISPDAKARIEEGQLLEGEIKPTKGAVLDILEVGPYENMSAHFYVKKILRDNEYNRNRAVTHGSLIIYEGRKHQVKRMLLSEGCRVVALKRVAINGLRLDENLQPGQYRELSEDEIELVTKNRDRM